MSEKIITNAEVFSLLDLCSAVIIDGTVVTFPSLVYEEDDEDNPDKIFLRLSYDMDDYTYDLEYSVKDNQNVKLTRSNTIVLTDTNYGEVELTLLTTINIPDLLVGLK